jgi:hypothetical protein
MKIKELALGTLSRILRYAGILLLIYISMVFYLALTERRNAFPRAITHNEAREAIADKARAINCTLDDGTKLEGFVVGNEQNNVILYYPDADEDAAQFLAELDLPISLTDVLITLLLSASSGLLHIYASIAIGHLWQKHSTLLGIIAYVVLSIINSRVLFYLSRTAFFAAHYTGASIAFNLVFSLIYAFICWIILERRLNLE